MICVRNEYVYSHPESRPAATRRRGSQAHSGHSICASGWSWRNAQGNFYFCQNAINTANYGYNNLNAYYVTWYHKFNSKWHTATESWYQYESKTPNIFNPAAASLLLANANGAWCKTPQQLTCYAPEWSILNYTSRQLGAHDSLSFRNEFSMTSEVNGPVSRAGTWSMVFPATTGSEARSFSGPS